MTQATATLYGLGDRGVLAPGFVGDANVIDHERPAAAPARAGERPARRRQPPHPAGRRLRARRSRAACRPSSAARTPAPGPARCCGAPGEPAPRETAAAFWAALYDRDWPRIRSFFGPDSIYYDVPTGPSSRPASGPTASRPGCGSGSRASSATSTARASSPRAPDGVVVTEHTEVWTWETGETVALPFVSVQQHRRRDHRALEGLLGLPDADGRGAGGLARAPRHRRPVAGSSTSPAAPERSPDVDAVSGRPAPAAGPVPGRARRRVGQREVDVGGRALRRRRRWCRRTRCGRWSALHERDQRASKDAFAVLDQIVEARLRRGLTTVSTRPGSSPTARAAWLAMARQHGPPGPRRGARRCPSARREPATSAREQPGAVEDRHRAAAHARGRRRHACPTRASTPSTTSPATSRVALVPPRFLTAPASARAQREDPVPLRFTLHLGRFAFPGKGPQLADNLRRLGPRRRGGGLRRHLGDGPRRADPRRVGPEWEDMPGEHDRARRSSPPPPSACSSAPSSTA